MSFEAIAILFAILVWVISGIVKGLKWLAAQLGGTAARPTLVQQAVADAQRQAAGSRPPGPAAPAGPRPALTSPPLVPAPVRYKTSAAEFVSQEQALLAEEGSGLGVPLTAPALPRPPKTAPLFGNVDDLVRAVILQEVLGQPLSRRSPAPISPAPPPA